MNRLRDAFPGDEHHDLQYGDRLERHWWLLLLGGMGRTSHLLDVVQLIVVLQQWWQSYAVEWWQMSVAVIPGREDPEVGVPCFVERSPVPVAGANHQWWSRKERVHEEGTSNSSINGTTEGTRLLRATVSYS